MTNVIARAFAVIEHRGANISYLVFTSDINRVERWIQDNTVEHPLNSDIRVHVEGYENGNGELFTYTVETWEDYCNRQPK